MNQVDEKQNPKLEALHQEMARNSLAGHWQPRQRNAGLVPFSWRWLTVYSCLMESGEVVPLGHAGEATRRRTVQLINPALTEKKATSRTLQMSVQLVKPGERAECHRHTAAALRFVVEGDGSGYTNVEGEQMLMETGDLILTPNWTWHDHHNAGEKPIIWLDVLDIHLTHHLDATIQEDYPEGPAQPISRTDGYCRKQAGAVRPRRSGPIRGAMPYAYKWCDTLQALEAMVHAGQSDPYDGVLLEYVNPVAGGPAMPTIGCFVQWLGPKEITRPHRHTSSTIYHVVKGEGVTKVGAEKDGGTELTWGPRDFFFVPSRMWHEHRNTTSKEPAILFSVTDRPVLDILGLYVEEQG